VKTCYRVVDQRVYDIIRILERWIFSLQVSFYLNDAIEWP
jgi:hypothetical protein